MKRSLSDSLLIGGACVFACWTIYCYLFLFGNATFADLSAWGFVPVVTGLILAALFVANPEPSVTAATDPPAHVVRAAASPGWLVPVIAVISLSIVILDVNAMPYWTVWVALLISSGLMLYGIVSKLNEPSGQVAATIPVQRAGALALVAVGVVLVAVTHRPDPDDALYLNIVVTALDFPDKPLFSFSGFWPGQSVPIEQPLYRFHTYELLIAFLSEISGVSHKALYYLVFAPLFGAAAVLVHWRLAQYLVPRYALVVVLVWLVLIVAMGESHRAFGNFAFVRMFQTKGPLVTVALPLCLLLGLRFAEFPGSRRALALGVGVTASIGLSTSALATAPFVVAAALAGGLMKASRESVVRIALGAAIALAMVLPIGVALFLSMEAWLSWGDTGALLDAQRGLHRVLGGKWLGGIILALFPIAPLFVGVARRRSMYAAATVFLVIVVMNPWTAPFLGHKLDKALEWRLFWSVPFVISAAVALTGLTASFVARSPRVRMAWILPLVLVSIVLVSDRTSLSPKNRVQLGFPDYKVVPLEHALAEEMVRRAPERATVFAPEAVAALLPTFRQHPYPVVVRRIYLQMRAIREHVRMPEISRREALLRFLEGRGNKGYPEGYFAQQLARDEPALVVYRRGVKTEARMSAALEATGYIVERRRKYWLWSRPNPSSGPEASPAAR